MPKVSGGWNVIALHTWNKAAITKLLWALAFKTDKLWVKWVHAYYVKSGSLWNLEVPAQASWALKKILGCRTIVNASGGWQQFRKNGIYSIQRAYSLLRDQAPKVNWRTLICHNTATPKSVFILWLMLQDKLATCDRLVKWLPNISPLCSLCLAHDENVQHLFFDCHFSAAVWNRMLLLLQQNKFCGSTIHELRRVLWQSRKRSSRSRLYVSCFTKTVYEVWRQRNTKLHQGTAPDPAIAYSNILFRL